MVWAEELGIPAFDGWLFKHDVVEVCTGCSWNHLSEAYLARHAV